jgi:hypothetical protein
MSRAVSNETKSHGRGHEERDVAFRPIAVAGVFLAVIILFSIGSMLVLFNYYLAREIRLSPAANPLAMPGERQPPEPRLDARPIEQLERLRSEETATLDTYGWVDRKQGIVRLPIERAMELMAERGVP